MTHKLIHKNLNPSKSIRPNTVQINGYTYKAVQKMKESVLPTTFFPLSLSYIHISSPISLISLHHLRFTRSLPVTFFTVQKSNATRMTTTRNVAISSSINKFRNKKQNILRPLKSKWNIHITGLLAVDKNDALGSEIF